jgi:hypothetical protein
VVVAEVEVCCIFGVRGIWMVGLAGEVCFMVVVGTDWLEEPALTWCSGNRSGVTLRFGGKFLSLKNKERGDVGAGVMFEDPKDRCEGRRLPREPFHVSPFSILARVMAMLGCFWQVGDRLRHIVGSESDLFERMLDLLLAVFRITGMEGEREVVFA